METLEIYWRTYEYNVKFPAVQSTFSKVSADSGNSAIFCESPSLHVPIKFVDHSGADVDTEDVSRVRNEKASVKTCARGKGYKIEVLG